MKKILLLLIAIGLLHIGIVNAQTVPQSATTDPTVKYNISFPIQELGNCTSLASCKAYCNDSSHMDACIAFAKQKGFYKETTTQPSVLTAAQQELGCSSPDACKTFCQLPENHDKCSSFAKGHNLAGGITTNPEANVTLQSAKAVLGCDSVDSCRAFCSQTTNQQKCNDFAKQNGLKGGLSKVGPGGCTSAASCNSYCADPSHFNDCSQYGKKDASGSATFTGPGGCNSESSCRDLCTKNPTVCQQFGKVSSNRISPTLNPTVSQDLRTFCQQNPDKCQQNGQTFPNTKAFCDQNPDKCLRPSISPYPSLPNTNNTSSGMYPSTVPNTNSNPTPSNNPAQSCMNQRGCVWTGTNCQCQPIQVTSIPSNPPSSINQTAPITTVYPSSPQRFVQGAETHRTLLQVILGFLHL